MNDKQLVFVYGSLRRGEFNHDRFPGFSSGFKCSGKIQGALLKSLGPYPALIPSDNLKDEVIGELYELPNELFSLIERMEHNAGYETKHVRVLVEANQEEAPGQFVPVSAKAYFFAKPFALMHVPALPGGDWSRRKDVRIPSKRVEAEVVEDKIEGHRISQQISVSVQASDTHSELR